MPCMQENWHNIKWSWESLRDGERFIQDRESRGDPQKLLIKNSFAKFGIKGHSGDRAGNGNGVFRLLWRF